MKKLIAIAAIVSSTQAFAFIGDNTDTQSMANGKHFAAADTAGNATGEGEATFSMSFVAKGKTAGDFKGNGKTDTDASGNFYGSGREYYYRPTN